MPVLNWYKNQTDYVLKGLCKALQYTYLKEKSIKRKKDIL